MNQKTRHVGADVLKSAQQKGITLIALVITIIVLLILAGVTISMVLGDEGIIAQAQEAKEAQKNAEESDKNALETGALQLERYQEGTPGWYAEKGELKVGDFVRYSYTGSTYSTDLVDEDEDGNGIVQTFDSNAGKNANVKETDASECYWRVLSVDNGIIQLVANAAKTPKITMYGAKAYLNAKTVLNEMCKTLYSGDYGTARSINANDINIKAGYNGSVYYKKNGSFEKVPSGITTIKELENELGVEIDYRTMPGGGNIDNLKLNFYEYSIVNRNDKKEHQLWGSHNICFSRSEWYYDDERIKYDPDVNQLLHAYDPAIDDRSYWIADTCEEINISTTGESYIKYGVRTMDYDMLARAHVWNAIEGSQDFDDKRSFRVLPVVTLKSGLQLTADGKVADRDGLNELKEYNVWKIN